MGRTQHFVLVHGAQHGAWCWYKTKALLESAGHRVSAPDLTSAGISAVNADNVKSFDHYNQPLHDVFESLGETEKVILVGHSYGGVPVARVTELYSRKIHVAVYIAGCMLCTEQPMSEVWPQVFDEFVNDMRFNFGRGAGTSPTSGWIVEETARRTYFGSCSPKDVQLGMMLLRPSPFMSDDATTFTEKGYHSVPRVYIKASLDLCLKPKFQDLFIQRNRPQEVRSIEAGHALQLCAAKELHRHLLQIAAAHVSDHGDEIQFS